jgi:hypothetical protein
LVLMSVQTEIALPSKHQLLEHWSQPEFIQDVAKIVEFV